MLKLLQFYLLTFAILDPLYAAVTERIEVLEISSSKKTMIIDKGHLRGVKVGDKATFILFSDSEEPLLEFAAFGEAIKVHTNYSFWYLSEIKKKELLVKGERLHLLSYDSFMAGARPLQIKQEKGVIDEHDTEGTYIRSRQEGVPSDKVRFQGKYEGGRELVKTVPLQQQDIETLEIDKWSKGGTKKIDDFEDEVEVRHFEEPALSDTNDIRESENIDNLKRLTQGLVSRSKHDRGWVDKLHRERKNRVSYVNAYKSAKKDKSEGIQLWAINKIKRDGPFWSADMSDSELRRFFKESGIAKEKAKQNYILDNLMKHEVQLGYAFGVSQNVSDSDLTNKGQSYSLNLDYEYNLGRTSTSLELFSIDIGLSAAKNFFDGGNGNASSSQFDYGATLNFYFYNKPSSLNKYIWFVGIGMKGGNATVLSTEGTSYSYQRYMMPMGRIGLKYRFFTGEMFGDTFGLGVNFFINYEYMKLSSLENLGSSNLNEVIEFTDIKVAGGLSVYF